MSMVSLATHESTLRMLIERVRWPVRMVRWRTAQEYASLIASKSQRKAALGVYFEWLAARQLESEVISGLAILQCLEERDLPDYGAVNKSINASSVLADVVLQSLYGLGKAHSGWESRYSGDAPPSFEPDRYFTDHKLAQIPGHLSHALERLEQRTGVPLMKQWAFEWKGLMDATQSPASGFPYFFLDNVDYKNGINGQFSQRQCDIYRSAFLRTIAFAVQKGMPRTFAAGLSTETISVNNDFVKLQPVARPNWLNDFPERCVAPAASLESECRRIIAVANSNGVFAANLKIPISWQVEKYGELQLNAVLATPDFQILEDDADVYRRRDLWMLGELASFNCLLPEKSPSELTHPGRVGICQPLTLEVWPYPSGFWHNDYFQRGISMPAPYLANPLPSVVCHMHSLEIQSAGKALGEWAVWHDHWSTLYPDSGNPRCGMITTVDRDAVTAAEANQNLKLGWIAELKVWRAKTYYEKLELSRKICFFWD
jgi:hypothetical protein